MKIAIESTDQITVMDGDIPVRVWKGRTEGGVPCYVFVHRVAVREVHDAGEFARELKEMPPVRFAPLREVMS